MSVGTRYDAARRHRNGNDDTTKGRPSATKPPKTRSGPRSRNSPLSKSATEAWGPGIGLISEERRFRATLEDVASGIRESLSRSRPEYSPLDSLARSGISSDDVPPRINNAPRSRSPRTDKKLDHHMRQFYEEIAKDSDREAKLEEQVNQNIQWSELQLRAEAQNGHDDVVMMLLEDDRVDVNASRERDGELTAASLLGLRCMACCIRHEDAVFHTHSKSLIVGCDRYERPPLGESGGTREYCFSFVDPRRQHQRSVHR